jgi:hypothetical protein
MSNRKLDFTPDRPVSQDEMIHWTREHGPTLPESERRGFWFDFGVIALFSAFLLLKMIGL